MYGRGHWSSAGTEKGVLRSVKTSRVLIARKGGALVATLNLATRKPWAIDPAYFTPARRHRRGGPLDPAGGRLTSHQ